jgi:negative regulator of sigma E activity
MDIENRLIQYLYGEEARPEDVEEQLASDDALRAEYQQLHAVKHHLDRRTPPKPDAAVVDRIVDAAAAATAEPAPSPSARSPQPAARSDREPVQARRTTQRRIRQVVAALAVLLVGVSIGVWQWEGSGPAAPPSEENVQATASSPAEPIPAWDEAENVVRLRRHIETLHARSSPTRWDYPGAELQTASQVRPLSND